MWGRLQSVYHGVQRSRGACRGGPSLIVQLGCHLYNQTEIMRLLTAIDVHTRGRVIIIIYICISKDINNIFFEFFICVYFFIFSKFFEFFNFSNFFSL